MTVYALLPAFNEATKIGNLLDELPNTTCGVELKALVIDDGSDDGTSDIVRNSGVEFIRLERNQGKGAALCRGVEELRVRSFDALIWMDTDGQHPVAAVDDLVGPVLDDGADLCVGSRYLADNQRGNAPLNRRLVRALVMRLVRYQTGFDVTDPFSGFRCFSPAAVERLRLVGCGYESELESCFSTSGAGLSYREVPIPRLYGPETSKMGYFHGAMKGRAMVLAGYARTLRRGFSGEFDPAKVSSRA